MTKWQKKLLYSIIVLLIFIAVTFIIINYFKPFFIIAIMLLLCAPIYNLLTRHKFFNNKINAVISIITVNLIIFIVLFLLGNFIIMKILVFLNSSLSSVSLEEIAKRLSVIFKFDLTSALEKLKLQFYNILNGESIRKGAVYTTEGLFAYFIGNIAAYFILADKETITRPFLQLIPKSKIVILKAKLEIINKIITIELIMILLTTLETILGFLCLRIKYALLLGVICGILDLLPYVGTILVFLPLILYKISCNNYITAFGLVILYILLQVIRQILEAKFMSNKIGVHPLLIILSLYIGIKLFGAVGLFMGPLYVITVKEFIINDELRLIN